MTPLVGWSLGGPCVREERAWLGHPAWSPSQLLRDLELRLGLPRADDDVAARLPAWQRALAAPREPFYAASLASDPIGTARTLLSWRDELVDAGWDGEPIPDGGPRLDALAAAQAHGGGADRLRAVETELTSSGQRPYDALALLEPRALWSVRWQRVFASLERAGVVVHPWHRPENRGADPATDLGAVQAMLRGEPLRALRGDGTFLVLRAETSHPLAERTAALLARHRDGAVVVRCTDPAPLEAALARHGLPGQGLAPASPWRPAMQLLPLALELAFAPRNPHRVIELLTLPVGLFRRELSGRLARAVAAQPGIGGSEWQRERAAGAARLRERFAAEDGGADPDARVHAELARVAEWIEGPSLDPFEAPREALLAVVNRVAAFLQPRLPMDATYVAAYRQAVALRESLAHFPEARLSREHVRQLLDDVVHAPEPALVSNELAHRIDHVTHPSAILVAPHTVVFWNFVSAIERRIRRRPWGRDERQALATAGVVFPDESGLLSTEAESWRRALLAARERVVLAFPDTLHGEPCAPHAMWDELSARLGAIPEAALGLATGHVPSLPLPAPRGAWFAPASYLEDDAALSATAIESLVQCPLQFVLRHRLRLRSGAVSKVASGTLLNGKLGHRLVEELHAEGAFALADEDFAARMHALFDRLIDTEGATLRLDGASFERDQLTEQIQRAMRALRSYLRTSRWRIAAVEERLGGTLEGRLDVRLVDDAGKTAILDLKWGESKYRERVGEGRAVQLAAYVHAVHDGVRSIPPAAYFSLTSGRVLTQDERMRAPRRIDGESLVDTWSRVEKTRTAVRWAFARGEIPVAATRRALPLLDALGVPALDRAGYYALPKAEDACDYCDHTAICGRRWEGT